MVDNINVSCEGADERKKSNEGREISKQVHYSSSDSWPEYKEDSLLESAVVEATSALQVSREMALTSALGAMSVACQGLVDVKQPTGNKVNTSLMLLTIAESGERKTTTENHFFESLREFQKTQIGVHKKDQQQYINKFEVWKHKKSALVSLLKKAVKNGEDSSKVEASLESLAGEEPKERRIHKFIYEDATPQALIQMMNKKSKNACLLSSEANSIFNGRVFGELHMINSLWDGGEVIVDRVSTGSFHLWDARLTLALMTQESVIEEFMSKRGEKARGMGFLARFLTVKPAQMAGNRDKDKLWELKELEQFNNKVRVLMSESWSREQSGEERSVVEFSSSAGKLWIQYSQDIEREMQQYRVYDQYKDHASKLMDNISRVAGVVHYFENKEGKIDRATLKFAYDICLKYSKHLMCHLAGEPEIIKNANSLVRYLIKKAKEDKREIHTKMHKERQYRNGYVVRFSISDIQQKGPNALRKGRDDYQPLLAVMDLLMKMGHIREGIIGRGREYMFFEVVPSEETSEIGRSCKSISDLWIPKLRNGYEYTIFSLPMFDDYIAVSGESISGIQSILRNDGSKEGVVRMMPVDDVGL